MKQVKPTQGEKTAFFFAIYDHYFHMFIHIYYATSLLGSMARAQFLLFWGLFVCLNLEIKLEMCF